MGNVTGGLVGRGVARFGENQDVMDYDEQDKDDANGIVRRKKKGLERRQKKVETR